MPSVWSNHEVNESLAGLLRKRVAARGWACVEGPGTTATEAEVLLGQPPLELLRECRGARWVHVTSAGYGRYVDAEKQFVERGTTLTKSSAVFAMPCAQHALAFMLAQNRQLAPALDIQRTDRRWAPRAVRGKARVLQGQKVALVGYGQIGACLSDLLAPFEARVEGLRRNPAGEHRLPMHELGSEAGDRCLFAADHVVNLLPGAESTEHFFDARRIAGLKPGSAFYNVGRGSTVDQEALARALQNGQLSAAWLDVVDPEPLPPEHALWSLPNCYITPHAAGGRQDEAEVLLHHFLDNFDRFVDGKPLVDVVRWPSARG